MQIVALLAVYNEELFMERAIQHLVQEGICVYVIDNGSTDNTRRIAQRFLGKGVFGLEDHPRGEFFEWEALLARKEQLHQELGADWYLHQDADAFYQAPPRYASLAAGIRAVDSQGYNAIDFNEFLFMPTGKTENFENERFLEEMRYYLHLRPQEGARFRINAWKFLGQRVDLVSSGGHQVQYPGRRVFPTRFIMRHYLALSYDHIVRKYCQKQYSQSELKKGWHGKRALLRPEDIRFPERSTLKLVSRDDTWDTSDPFEEEPLFAAVRKSG